MSWLKNGLRLSPEPLHRRRGMMVAFRQPGTLRERLARGRWLLPYLRWEEGDGTQRPYPEWTETMKTRLDACFHALGQNQPYVHAAIDPAAQAALRYKPNPPGGGRGILIPAAQAFDLYAGQVAHVLHVEAGRLVPWSLADMDEVELLELLSSDRYFRRLVPSPNLLASTPAYYPAHIRPGRDYQLPFDTDGQVHDPRTGYRFLRGLTSTTGRDLVGATARETLRNLTRWCGESVHHGTLSAVGADLNDWFQLEDRLRRRTDADGRTLPISRPAWGCHGTANLLHDLGRCINLPLIKIDTGVAGDPGGHLGLVFFDGWEEPEPAVQNRPDPPDPPDRPGRPGRGFLDSVVGWFERALRGLYQAAVAIIFPPAPALRRIPWVVPHVDDLYAEGFAPSFPVRPDGTLPGDEERWELFFTEVWSTRSGLASWGFHSPPHYDLRPHSDPLDDLPNRGVEGGFWLSAGHDDAFEYERKMRLGSWNGFLQYCPDASRIASSHAQLQSARSSPVATYLAKYEACVAHFGSCAAIRSAYIASLAARQINVLAAAPGDPGP